MLQQTRLETVLPYYARFLRAFPTIESLAAAPLDDVLKQWEGLGYYSRARNMQRAAQLVMREHDGQLPRAAADLRKLPGIGAYTAGAIASIAFGQAEAAVDANVTRVITRLLDMDADISLPATKREVWRIARAWLPAVTGGRLQPGVDAAGAARLPSAQSALWRMSTVWRLPRAGSRHGRAASRANEEAANAAF